MCIVKNEIKKADWLCSDETELDQYIADELSKEDISAGLFYQLLDSMKRLANPILLEISGNACKM